MNNTAKGSKPLPRGLRNCNTGNIRISPTKYQGEIIPSCDRAFKQFRSLGWGYRAMFVLLESYKKRGFDTIRKMISRWAPPSENNTAGYIQRVCDGCLHGADEVIDTRDKNVMVLIVCAMSKVENGVPANMADVLEGWDLFITHKA